MSQELKMQQLSRPGKMPHQRAREQEKEIYQVVQTFVPPAVGGGRASQKRDRLSLFLEQMEHWNLQRRITMGSAVSALDGEMAFFPPLPSQFFVDRSEPFFKFFSPNYAPQLRCDLSEEIKCRFWLLFLFFPLSLCYWTESANICMQCEASLPCSCAGDSRVQMMQNAGQERTTLLVVQFVAVSFLPKGLEKEKLSKQLCCLHVICCTEPKMRCFCEDRFSVGNKQIVGDFSRHLGRSQLYFPRLLCPQTKRLPVCSAIGTKNSDSAWSVREMQTEEPLTCMNAETSQFQYL